MMDQNGILDEFRGSGSSGSSGSRSRIGTTRNAAHDLGDTHRGVHRAWLGNGDGFGDFGGDVDVDSAFLQHFGGTSSTTDHKHTRVTLKASSPSSMHPKDTASWHNATVKTPSTYGRSLAMPTATTTTMDSSTTTRTIAHGRHSAARAAEDSRDALHACGDTETVHHMAETAGRSSNGSRSHRMAHARAAGGACEASVAVSVSTSHTQSPGTWSSKPTSASLGRNTSSGRMESTLTSSTLTLTSATSTPRSSCLPRATAQSAPHTQNTTTGDWRAARGGAEGAGRPSVLRLWDRVDTTLRLDGPAAVARVAPALDMVSVAKGAVKEDRSVDVCVAPAVSLDERTRRVCVSRGGKQSSLTSSTSATTSIKSLCVATTMAGDDSNIKGPHRGVVRVVAASSARRHPQHISTDNKDVIQPPPPTTTAASVSSSSSYTVVSFTVGSTTTNAMEDTDNTQQVMGSNARVSRREVDSSTTTPNAEQHSPRGGVRVPVRRPLPAAPSTISNDSSNHSFTSSSAQSSPPNSTATAPGRPSFLRSVLRLAKQPRRNHPIDGNAIATHVAPIAVDRVPNTFHSLDPTQSTRNSTSPTTVAARTAANAAIANATIPIVASSTTTPTSSPSVTSSTNSSTNANANATNQQPQNDELRLPLTPRVTLAHYARLLTSFERNEILSFPEIYFAGASSIEKVQSPRRPTGACLGEKYNVVGSACAATTTQQQRNAAGGSTTSATATAATTAVAATITDDDGSVFNDGFDDARGDYYLTKNDHIRYRYEILSLLGKGSFGQVVKCYDHKTKSNVAVKIVRNKKRFEKQGQVEVRVLMELRDRDTDGRHCLVHALDAFHFRGHLCIAFEMLGCNLYEWIKAGGFKGINTIVVRYFAAQILSCLALLQRCKMVHCDLKPENILLVDRSIRVPGAFCQRGAPALSMEQLAKYRLKVIDFGSSCLESERIYTYVQSRFYRSPEVMLGAAYGTPIDMWSFGCILAELYTGYPLFPGESEQQQMQCIMEVRGLPPREIFEKATRAKLFFNADGSPRLEANSKGRIAKPGALDLQRVLKTRDFVFVDFLQRCLEWDPNKRMTPFQAMKHPFIAGHGFARLADAVAGAQTQSLLRQQQLYSSSSEDLRSVVIQRPTKEQTDNTQQNLPRGRF